MSIRTSLAGELRFDERLVLYGWQEDSDFTCQLRSRGRVVGVNAIRGVHLGLKSEGSAASGSAIRRSPISST
jgi:hypothetical protein